MGRALYRTHRSRSLDEIVGQDHITSLLKRAIAADRVSHAYLLTGPKGVGKTSIARIIAHEINGLEYSDESSHLDIIEIDAASNNGVEDVRDLREKVHIAPSIAKKKVYVIDEVHMLSKAAFNALLKTLEEPPEHVVFILATTDVEKLPQTIISRVQRFNFRRIPKAEVVAHLKTIAKKESIKIDNAALERIAEYGEGSFRDSIGLLDQLKDSVTPQTITIDDVNQTLGATDNQTITTLLDAVEQQDLPTIVTTLQALEASGVSAKTIKNQLIEAVASNIITTPSNLALLDRLTSLVMTQHPYLRLLVALSAAIAPSPSTERALSKPKAPLTRSSATIKSAAAKTEAKPLTVAAAQPASQTDDRPDVVAATHQPLAAFSWSALLELIKPDAVAIATLLGQSDYQLDGETLHIYTKQAFRAKRLLSAKYLSAINQALASLGYSYLTIEVSPGTKPSTDSSVTAVTDIMGGGEEVNLNGE